ncbi:MAG TPA: hypothetical protein VND91_00450 [Candidatus Saccharimonadia bacterium]|nr:hypothetical protein [Candidatus Saccharimonadia bacterium]
MRKTLIAAAIAVAATFAGAASAQDRVRLLGVSTLDAREGDRDVVAVSCRPRVSAIKLRSVAGTAEIQRVALTYGNGERDVIRVRDVLPRGDETGWIDLRGARRCVTSITVVGDAERGRGYRDDDRRYRRDEVGYDRRDRYDRYDDRYDARHVDRYDARHVDRYDDRRDDRYDDRYNGRRRPRTAVEIYGRFGY